MAGEWIINQMKARGGNANEYADIVFSTVISTKPLKVQLSEKITLDAPFLIVGNSVTDHDLKITMDGKQKTITITNGLKPGDKVAMFRMDGGQQFYIFDKINDLEGSD